jgi:dienelactone hydrolase
MNAATTEETVAILVGSSVLNGDLRLPPRARGLVIFAHGSGSSRLSGRNRRVAEALNAGGFATLLLDLLTPDEESVDMSTREYRFDIPRLAARVAGAAQWARTRPEVGELPTGYFGASTGAAAALIAAADLPDVIRAVVSRGGRPDLAGDALPRVRAPTLLIVGGADHQVIALNEEAMQRMTTTVEVRIVPGATHLFEEPGTLEEVERVAGDWFARYLV